MSGACSGDSVGKKKVEEKVLLNKKEIKKV